MSHTSSRDRTVALVLSVAREGNGSGLFIGDIFGLALGSAGEQSEDDEQPRHRRPAAVPTEQAGLARKGKGTRGMHPNLSHNKLA